nr:conserved hypothetical protein (N-terminal fragment) [Melanopsichium pennsylvanicum 4]
MPKEGSTPQELQKPSQFSAAKRQTYNTRRKSSRPTHHAQFNPFDDDFYEDIDNSTGLRGQDLGTAKRTLNRSLKKRTPSPNSRMRAQLISPLNDISIEIPTSITLDKGKGKSADIKTSPRRMTRNSRRTVSQSEVIHIDESDDDDVQLGSPPLSASRPLNSPKDDDFQSPALQVKAKRRRQEATTVSAASPASFYSNSSHGRRQGPIRMEEPNEQRKADSRQSVLVPSSPEPQPARQKMIERMKPRCPSPNASTVSQRTSPGGFSYKPMTSPIRSPHAQAGVPGPSCHAFDTNGASQNLKRWRTDSFSSSPDHSRPGASPLLPLEVCLVAIVVSDIWRSDVDARPFALFNHYHVRFGTTPNSMVQIHYGDIERVFASSPDVKDHPTLCITLKYGSQSAKLMQKTFRDFDTRASGDAAEIQLIAQKDQLEQQKHAAPLLMKRWTESSSSNNVDFNWLTEPNARSKISSVAGVKQLPWPQPQEERQPQQERSKRTLIVPGAGRTPSIDTRDSAQTSAWYSPQLPKKKTFEIQPASPTSAAGSAVDVDMPDASPPAKSSTLPSLTVTRTRSRPATYAASHTETRVPPLYSPTEHILTYPNEGIGAVSVHGSDYGKLNDGSFLNDVIIEFGLKIMIEAIRDRDPDLADSVHIFNTFFWKQLLAESTVETSYRRVRRWTSKVDLFSKKYIVVPINEDYHWYLAVIVNPGLMLVDKDNISEQDKEEVASSLIVARKTVTSMPAESAAQADDTVQKDADASCQEKVKHAKSSEPGTPPLPPLDLPTKPSHTAISIEVDRDSRASTPTKTDDEPVDLNQTFIITFDSLGSKHIKVGNKLHEYLWREALDKERLTLPLLEKLVGREEAKQAAQHDFGRLQTRAQETVRKAPAKGTAELLMNDPRNHPRDGGEEDLSDDEAAPAETIRKVQVQDSRQDSKGAPDKPTDAEALAKRLPKAPYIDARVPPQPNFCDCGIYLLHYFDRFFHEPETLLQLVVNSKRRIMRANKMAPAARENYKNEVDNEVQLAWQAGEVSKKRQFWRTKIQDQARHWKRFLKSQKAAEAAMKREKSEDKRQSSSEEKAVIENESRQTETEAEVVPNDPMDEAGQGVDAVNQPSQAESSSKPQAENGTDLGMAKENPSDDIEQYVNKMVLGRDPNGGHVVDGVLMQALSKHNKGPLSEDNLGQAQNNKQEETPSQMQPKSSPEWQNSSPAQVLSWTQDSQNPVSSTSRAPGVLPLAPGPDEVPPSSTRMPSSSVSASQHDETQWNEQSQQRPPPASFGSFMLSNFTQSWNDTQSSLSFTSSNNLKRAHEEERDGMNSSIELVSTTLPAPLSRSSANDV